MNIYIYIPGRLRMGSCSHGIKEQLYVAEEGSDKPKQCVEEQRCYSLARSQYTIAGCGLPSGHSDMVVELDCKKKAAKELMPLNCSIEDF